MSDDERAIRNIIEGWAAAAHTGETLLVWLVAGLVLGLVVLQPASNPMAAPSAIIRARTGCGLDIGGPSLRRLALLMG